MGECVREREREREREKEREREREGRERERERERKRSFFDTQLNSFSYCYVRGAFNKFPDFLYRDLKLS